jgi:hypothetical protein
MNSPNLSQLLQTVEEAANATALADAVKALAEAQISETIPALLLPLWMD